MYNYPCYECEVNKKKHPYRECTYSRYYKGICRVITGEKVFNKRRKKWLHSCRAHMRAIQTA